MTVLWIKLPVDAIIKGKTGLKIHHQSHGKQRQQEADNVSKTATAQPAVG